MPWKECDVMDARTKFIARLLDEEQMSEVCRDFGISRKTGYKIWNRYQNYGAEAFTDRSRQPVRYANQLPRQLETLIIRMKKEKPSWGAPKIRERMIRKYPEIKTPAKSTIHAVLDRNGFVKRRRKKRYKAQGTGLSLGQSPNDLWCADFKGQFMLGN
jgi:transposase-like protein